jgi:tRNA-specific 2-thiouridylase
MFPIGDRPKAAVRDYARRRRLPVADKPDSQEICFVPDGNYAAFVSGRTGDALPHGDVVDERGRLLGRHSGIHRFTVGQRKGLGLSSSNTGRPMYVLELRPADRQVVVGPRAALERTTFSAADVNWIGGCPDSPVRAAVQIRHHHAAAPATVRPTGDRAVEVTFDDPQAAITPGQAAVFYDADEVLGGGWIQ